MSNWFKRLFNPKGEHMRRTVAPTGNEHDYRPPRCDRSHDWAVQDAEVVDGTRATMRIEAWGAQFRSGDKIVIGASAETWWIVGVTKAGNTWFPDRALLDLANTLDQS